MGVVAFVAVVVALCGHQTQPFPLHPRHGVLAGKPPRRGPDARVSDEQASQAPESIRAHKRRPTPPQTRTADPSRPTRSQP